MKKNGFTLAEVLITLAIIGVVATLTLPALMTNTAEQQAKTAIKKAVNTLTEAATMNSTVYGFDYGSVIQSGDGNRTEDSLSLYSLFSNQLSIDWKATNDGKQGYKYGFASGGSTNYDTGNYTLFLRDGSSISFANNASMANATANTMQSDGLPYGIPIVYDSNGNRGPNLLSNCEGKIGSSANTESAATADCSQKAKKVIKDRFGLRLRNSVVVPNGPAARYLYEK